MSSVVVFPHAVPPRDPLGDVVQDWLFLVFRYALSREARDRRAVLDLAVKMDTLGQDKHRNAFRFFQSYSDNLCRAIAAPETVERRRVLQMHARRIEQPRLRQAFQVICHLELPEKMVPRSGRANGRSELRKGLQRR